MYIAQITRDGRVFLSNGEELEGIYSVQSRQDIDDLLHLSINLRYNIHEIERARSIMGEGVLPVPEGAHVGTVGARQTLTEQRFRGALNRVRSLERTLAQQDMRDRRRVGTISPHPGNVPDYAYRVPGLREIDRHAFIGDVPIPDELMGAPRHMTFEDLETIAEARGVEVAREHQRATPVMAEAIQTLADAGRTVVTVDGERQGYEN